MRVLITLCLIILVVAYTNASPGEGRRGGKKKGPRNEEGRPGRERPAPNGRPGNNNRPSSTTQSSTTTVQPTQQPNRPVKQTRFHDNMNRNGPMPNAPSKNTRRRPNSRQPGSGGAGTAQRGIGNTQQQGVPQTKQINSNGLTPQQKEVFLNAHNEFRSQVVSPSAANMVQMEWDDTLAEMAQGWSDQCEFAHGNPANISPYSWVGQNIWAGSGTGWDHYGMVEDWYNEVNDYTYQSNSCSGVCGHYTQIVWAESTHVGCAITTCTTLENLGWSPATILVCNYGEGGNYVGQKPYVSGPPCSQCPSTHPVCVDGKLCAVEGSNPSSGTGGQGGNSGSNTGGNGGSNTGGNGDSNGGGSDDGNTGGNNGGSGGNSECGGTLTSPGGSFTSPGWSAPYPLNSHCQWIIQGKPNDKITLTMTYMDVEDEPNCSWDYLQIRTSSSDLGIKYCGMQTPPPITSESGFMLVTFHSDYTVPRGGFTASYRIITNHQDACGGVVEGAKGVVTSPGWPTPYDAQQDCTWTITVPHKKRVSIWFTAFNLEDHETCAYDHVTLQLGDEKVPMRLCGSDVSAGKYTSKGREVQLRFRSTNHVTGKKIGFRAQFKAVR